MDYIIRKMEAEDWGAVSKIYKDALAKGISTFERECPSYKEWDERHIAECRFAMTTDPDVAKEKIVGWCALSKTSSRDAYKGVAEVSIYFDEDFQEKGLGTMLLNRLSEMSECQGYYSLYAAIFSCNIASIALHKKCGFREIGYREKIARDIFGEWQDTTLMERRIK